ncbi:WD40/YVTN/BNR-like repeat-containing protein [Acidovorax bellezanensis]|nr:YCF48-related protein [Acidovorax sp. Be4]
MQCNVRKENMLNHKPMTSHFYPRCLLALGAAVFCAGLGAQPAGTFEDPLDVSATMVSAPASRPLMAITSAGNRLVALGMRGLIVISDDAGQSWRQASAPVQSDLLAVHFPTPSKGWAVGHDGVILHSTDAGLTWAKQSDGRIAATTMMAEYRTRISAGETAIQPYLDQLALNFKQGPSLPYLGIYFTDEQQGFAVGSFGTLVSTRDAGKTWHAALDRIDNPQFLHLNAIREIAGTLYIAAEKGTVFRQDKTTGQFRQIQTGYGGSFFGIAGNREQLLAYGLRGNVHQSRDQGQTWAAIRTPLQGTVTGGVYMPTRRAVVLSTVAGEVASIDTDRGDVRPLVPPRPAALTGVEGLKNGNMVYTSLSGVITTQAQ